MIRKGSLVVPLPNKRLPGVYQGRIGKVDLVGKKKEIITSNLLSVEFSDVIESFGSNYKLFRKDEVRPATKEEARAYRFVARVRGI